MYDGDVFEVEGREFKVRFEDDDYEDPPWEREDGHGPVSKWREADSKRPGEMVLCKDRSFARFYDYEEAVKMARRDGWGAKGDEGMEGGEKAAFAARKDYERLAAWCENQWCYVVMTVTLLDEEGEETGEREVLGGLESDGGDYLDQEAKELAGVILHNMVPLAGWRI